MEEDIIQRRKEIDWLIKERKKLDEKQKTPPCKEAREQGGSILKQTPQSKVKEMLKAAKECNQRNTTITTTSTTNERC